MRTVIDPDTGEEFDLRWTDDYLAEINAANNGWCQHPTTELRCRIIANGQITYWHQCQMCGRFPGSAVRKPDDADRIPDADTTLKDRYDAQRAAVRQEIEQRHVRIQKMERANWWRQYDQHVNSPAWKVIRRAVMERAKGICEGCGSRPATQVHHQTYKNFGNEFLWELKAVCDHCHARCHPEQHEDAA
jgi:hypothetical protein